MHLYPRKTECGCPSGGGIKNGHIVLRYPSYGGTHNFFFLKKEASTGKERQPQTGSGSDAAPHVTIACHRQRGDRVVKHLLSPAAK